MIIKLPENINKIEDMDGLFVAVLKTTGVQKTSLNSTYKTNFKLEFINKDYFIQDTNIDYTEGSLIPKYMGVNDDLSPKYTHNGIIALCVNPRRFKTFEEMINDILYTVM